MGTVILITGGSSGLGKFLADYLSERGFVVFAGMRTPAASDGSVIPLCLDVTDNGSCQEALERIYNVHGRMDVLINCAAITLAGPTDSFTPEQFHDVLDVNLVGPFRLIRTVLPMMRKQQSGRIINITSLNGRIAFPGFGLYGASKFGLEALGLSVGCELAGTGVFLTNIAPGAIAPHASTMGRKLPHVPAREKFWIIRTLMPMVTADEIARAVERVIRKPKPPSQLALGRDVKITVLLQRWLPRCCWDWLVRFVWTR